MKQCESRRISGVFERLKSRCSSRDIPAEAMNGQCLILDYDLLVHAGYWYQMMNRASVVDSRGPEATDIISGSVKFSTRLLHPNYLRPTSIQPTSVHIGHMIKKVELSSYRPRTPIGSRCVKDPTLSRKSAHRWR
jgi:hypothetical protein